GGVARRSTSMQRVRSDHRASSSTEERRHDKPETKVRFLPRAPGSWLNGRAAGLYPAIARSARGSRFEYWWAHSLIGVVVIVEACCVRIAEARVRFPPTPPKARLLSWETRAGHWGAAELCKLGAVGPIPIRSTLVV